MRTALFVAGFRATPDHAETVALQLTESGPPLVRCAAMVQQLASPKEVGAHAPPTELLALLAQRASDHTCAAAALRVVALRNPSAHKAMRGEAVSQALEAVADDDTAAGQADALYTLGVLCVDADTPASLVHQWRLLFSRTLHASRAPVREAAAVAWAYSTVGPVECPLRPADAAALVKALRLACAPMSRLATVLARVALCVTVLGAVRFHKSRGALLEAGVVEALELVAPTLGADKVIFAQVVPEWRPHDVPSSPQNFACVRQGVAHLLAEGCGGARVAAPPAAIVGPADSKQLSLNSMADLFNAPLASRSPSSLALSDLALGVEPVGLDSAHETQRVDAVAPGWSLERQLSGPQVGCFVCALPIAATEERACAKSDTLCDYAHPECLRCAVCDSASFSTRVWRLRTRVLCLSDYLREAGFVCKGCNAVVSDLMVKAMGSVWHRHHFVCATCGVQFKDSYYRHNGKPYCALHVRGRARGAGGRNVGSDSLCAHALSQAAEALGMSCASCGKAVTGGVRALDKTYHPECFVCATCRQPFGHEGFFLVAGKPLCKADALRVRSSPVCGRCGGALEAGVVINAIGKKWHEGCFVCHAPECGVAVAKVGFYAKDGVPYCKQHRALAAELCARCGEVLVASSGRVYAALGAKYHEKCFVCTESGCNVAFGDNGFYAVGTKPYCEQHARPLSTSTLARHPSLRE